jgi:hypothetical protein
MKVISNAVTWGVTEGSHDSSFAKLAKEQKEEEMKRKQMGNAGGNFHVDEMESETLADEEFDLSQTRQERVSKEVHFEQ